MKVQYLSYDKIDETIAQIMSGKLPVEEVFPITPRIMRDLFRNNYIKTNANPHYGSKITSMFKNNASFDTGNWASGENFIRIFFEIYPITGSIDLTVDNTETIVMIQKEYKDDQHYLQMTFGSDWELISGYDHYIMTWYKNRGRTEQIYKNGRPITLDEFVYLCNRFFVILQDPSKREWMKRYA